MSALGQKRLGQLRLMSALPPKADIGVSLNDLCFSKIGSCASFLGRRRRNISTHRRSIIVRQGWRGCGHRNTAEENSENPFTYVSNGFKRMFEFSSIV